MITRRIFHALALLFPFIRIENKQTPIGYVVEQRMEWNDGVIRIDYAFFPSDKKKEAFSYADKTAFSDYLRVVKTNCYAVYK